MAIRLLACAVLAVFVLTADLGWYLAGREARAFAWPVHETPRTWVDDTVGPDGSVTVVAAGSLCRGWDWSRSGFLLAEFFNTSVGRVAFVGSPPDSLPYSDVRVMRSGHLLLSSDERLRANYVLTEPGVRLDGRRLAQETRARLTLWEVRGQVRVMGVGSNREFEQAVCRDRPAPPRRGS